MEYATVIDGWLPCGMMIGPPGAVGEVLVTVGVFIAVGSGGASLDDCRTTPSRRLVSLDSTLRGKLGGCDVGCRC